MSVDRFITLAEAREMLRRAYHLHGEINLATVLRRSVSDPIKPIAENGSVRPSISLVVVCAMMLLLIVAFVYFSFGGRG